MKLTPEVVRELMHYDPETGIFTWRQRGRHWFKEDRFYKSWNSKHSGRRAGYVWTSTKHGYQCRMIKLLSSDHMEHQLAWLYMSNDPLPDGIDHKNRDGTDNRWENLRATTPADNSKNQSRRKNNASGVTGVCWSKHARKWEAYSHLNRHRHYLGVFHEIDEAAMEVMEFRAENGFDPSHGIEKAHYHGVSA